MPRQKNQPNAADEIEEEEVAQEVVQASPPARIVVPTSVADMRPPKPSSVITEAANFLRAHWEEVMPFYQSISGEIPSKHGSLSLDEAECVFEVKRIAGANGYAFLASIPTVRLRTALRFGYKRNTGTPMWKLEKQYKLLQIEHRRAAAQG